VLEAPLSLPTRRSCALIHVQAFEYACAVAWIRQPLVAVPGMRDWLLTVLTPTLKMFGVQTTLTAIHNELFRVHGGRLDHRCKLVTG